MRDKNPDAASQRRNLLKQRGILPTGDIGNYIPQAVIRELLELSEAGRDYSAVLQRALTEARAKKEAGSSKARQPRETRISHRAPRRPGGFIGTPAAQAIVASDPKPAPVPALPKGGSGENDWRGNAAARKLVEATVETIKALGLDASDILEPKTVTQIVEREIEPRWKTWECPTDSYVKPSYWAELNSLIDEGEHVLLVWPSGCGKSQAFEAVAAARNVNHYIVDCSVETSIATVIGARGIVPGNGDVFRAGKAVRALQDPGGAVFELSEMDFVDPAVLSRLHRLLTPSRTGRYTLDVPDFYEAGCEVSNAGKLIIGADANTTGRRVDRRYSGTVRLNEAFLNRWQIIEVGYENEAEIAHRATGIDEDEAFKIEYFAQAWRFKMEQAGIAGVFTTRDVIRVAKYRLSGLNFDKSVTRVIRGKLEPNELIKLGVHEGKAENVRSEIFTR